MVKSALPKATRQLVLAQLFLALEYRRSLRFIALPVDLGVLRIVQFNLAYRMMLLSRGIFGMLSPGIPAVDVPLGTGLFGIWLQQTPSPKMPAV